jgi:hypothetical protein
MNTRRQDNMDEMKRVLRLLARAERIAEGGATFDDALLQLKVSRKEFEAYFDQYAVAPNGGESLTASPLLHSVVPVFRDSNTDELEHAGSGVVLAIGDELFVLSAAHVFDDAINGNLYIPAVENIEAMHGGISHGVMPTSGQRKDDRVDVAYFHLGKEWGDKLHPAFSPLTVDDLLLTDSVQTGNLHTFAGYPWRKTKHRGIAFSGDTTSYTGHLMPPDVYAKYGYSRIAHILIRMRRKKTHSTRYGPNSPAAHPEGISGGAVFAWPPTFKQRMFSPTLKLAGIAHTYHEKDHCMAGTRVISCVMAIVRNNPQLVSAFDEVEVKGDEFCDYLDEIRCSSKLLPLPSAVGITWYTQHTYARCLRIFDDAAELPDTFDEWQDLAKETEANIRAAGMIPLRVQIDPETFPNWCKRNGIKVIDKDARMAFGNLKAFEFARQHIHR